ncbi:uncharacterized protein [Euwallacea fornicatus]|uniref:uncharacterized protein n=1 Tax=Euwallacea fornicatus TaxID=995702 RepID=UPI003390153F
MGKTKSSSINIPSSRSPKKVVWKKETTLQFIRLLEKQELLWNPDHRDYNNNAEAWKTIEKTMNIDIKDLKNKLKWLESEYRKRRIAPASQNWYAYTPLDKFLKKLPWLGNSTQLPNADNTSTQASTPEPPHTRTSPMKNFLLTGNIRGKTPKPNVSQVKFRPGTSKKST